ncbi:hypothetical protein DEO72_LG10g1784 [Vigna unguiculata]|uniref:Uncharacterized protein n=1 Tax=Vigna unguiculata TaxID=3917 RepID=A0A4D6NCR8_VIGUN|nr:hypothetical protein DEO72_LG10g1784 [Vigna unguiculata]
MVADDEVYVVVAPVLMRWCKSVDFSGTMMEFEGSNCWCVKAVAGATVMARTHGTNMMEDGSICSGEE